MSGYDHRSIEKKWQQFWLKNKTFRASNDSKKPKHYVLDMFPYPSSAGLHVGHPLGYTATDIVSRFLRMNGYNVLHPMGWDAFGLPAENYAIKTKVHPEKTTSDSITTFRRQIQELGFSYDWEREVGTCFPDYYKWTQWFFAFLYKNDLAYRKNAAVNWCESCHTVLANEQVINGKCERCKNDVVQKKLEQWFFKIRDFIEDQGKTSGLIHGLDKIDWPESTKISQRNWIGKSEGAEVDFEIPTNEEMKSEYFPESDADMTNIYLITWNTVALENEKKEAVRKIELEKFLSDDENPNFIRGAKLIDSMEKARQILRALREAEQSSQEMFRVLEAVTAEDHVHAIVSISSEATLGEAMNYLKGISARRFFQKFSPSANPGINAGVMDEESEKNENSHHLWRAGYHFSRLARRSDFENVYAYLRRHSQKAKNAIFLSNIPHTVTVFTTRPDTLFGVAYFVLAPEHPLVSKITTTKQYRTVQEFLVNTAQKSELERTEEKEKTGVFTGAYAVNPVNGEKVPVWIADYVLMTYGTGAVMAVPAHDERDFAFAAKYKLPIRIVVSDSEAKTECFSGEGIATNSEFLDGLATPEAKEKIIQWLEKNKKGKRCTEYKLRDWLISRQRYWGAPIPVVYDDQGDHYLLPEDERPVNLPHDVDFMPTGESPLTRSKTFHDPKDLQRIEDKLKKSGMLAKERKIVRRESDTMDTFVCSSWYFFRFMDPQNVETFADKKLLEQWGPVDLYVGGAEHTVLHLLYARFFTKALHKYGYISYDEPFQKLRHQGMILGEDGQKMSKSRGNVINPDEIIEAFGADTLRCYEMFMGPFDQRKPWSTGGVEGVRRFLDRVWRVFEKPMNNDQLAMSNADLNSLLHQTIEVVTEHTQDFRFNTAISQLMVLTNELTKLESVPREALETFALLLSPFAPHLAEEVWSEILGHEGGISYVPWPKYDAKYLQNDTVRYAVQVNGKLRADFEMPKTADKAEVLAAAKVLPKVLVYLEGKEVVKEVFVPEKIVGFVVK